MLTRLLAFWWVTVLRSSDGGKCSGRSEAVKLSNYCTDIYTINLDLKILDKP